MAESILEIRDLHKRYGQLEALRGVSFEVTAGEMFGLLGPNGAGKTTLLSILACLTDSSSGEVRLNGQSLDRSKLEQRHLIGIGTQDLALYLDFDARENLRFFGKLYGLKGSDLETQIEKILELTGLEERADQKVSTYSGGMKRRLNLGVAVIHRPRILLLDEPTTGVDPQSRNHIFERIRELNRDGMTILYTSHYMEEVQALCTRVGIMDHGKLIACDTLPNLLKLQSGEIRLTFTSDPASLQERLRSFSDIQKQEVHDHRLSVSCSDLVGTLTRIINLLPELNLKLERLETQEPNLERVFLHLTERNLRD